MDKKIAHFNRHPYEKNQMDALKILMNEKIEPKFVL